MVLIPLVHQGSCCYCFWLCLSTSFLGGVATHSPGLHREIVLEFITQWGQLHLGQIIFGPLPHHPKIHHRDYIERIPLNAKLSSALQTYDGISRLYSHCTSPENGVQARYSIPDARWTGSCQQTIVLVPPWKSVLGFVCATPKWNRLIQTTLGCVIYCTGCDQPRWSCISKLTVPQVALELKCCCSQLLPWVHPSHPVLCWS